MTRAANTSKSQPQPPEPNTFTQAVIIVNPVSTQANTADRKIADIRKLFPKDALHVVESNGKGTTTPDLLKTFRDILGSHTLLGIVAGDGTINQVIDFLLFDENLSQNARKSVILPLWGGNANDLAWMLNGGVSSISIRSLLKNGKIVPIRALQFDFVDSEHISTHIAATTASIGASAVVANVLNKSSHRNSPLHLVPGGRFIHESLTVFNTFRNAKTFTVIENNKKRQMFEYTFANGSRMAKHYRMPVHLTDDWFYLSETEGKRPVITSTMLATTLVRKASSKVFKKHVSITLIDEVMAQFDGEAIKIRPGTEIRVQFTALPFYALTTVLA